MLRPLAATHSHKSQRTYLKFESLGKDIIVFLFGLLLFITDSDR